MKRIFLLVLLGSIIACKTKKDVSESHNHGVVKVVGAMKNVMWKGELGPSIDLDTLSKKKGLYGVGPLVELAGELMFYGGIAYISKVQADSSIQVQKSFEASAPFFVYSQVTEWDSLSLPSEIQNIQQLEQFLDSLSQNKNRPFAFRLEGMVQEAVFHIQNLPKGTKVSSPKEAHQGQVTYSIDQEKVFITGFFSTEHQGVFTHHDSYLHMHLLTADEKKMGHLDEAQWGKMQLYLPKE